MTVLKTAFKITSVRLKGLETIDLPVISHWVDADFDDSPVIQGIEINMKDKYFVKSITGLEPPDQTVAIAKTASGGKYQGKSSANREVVVLLGLNPDESKGETNKLLRDNLYTMLSTGYDPKVMIQLCTLGFPVAQVASYVTHTEASLFEKDALAQFTLTCLDPVFKALSVTAYPASQLDPKHPNVLNYGTAETGFKFQVHFLDDMSGWSIKQAEHQAIGMTFDMDFNEGDILSVSTVPGQTYIHWNKHHGKVKNKMGILTNNSEWITLHPGANRFVVPKGGGTKWAWKGSLQFTAQYWGV